MGLDDQVAVPLYALKDGLIYVHRLGTLEPLTIGAAERLRDGHRNNADFYARADPDRAKDEAAKADLMDDLLRLRAEETEA